MTFQAWRRERLSKPLYRWARGFMPRLSDTERQALDAGDIWWDGALFSGNPDWSQLLATPPARLTDAESAFIDGPVTTLCGMLDDWNINWQRRDLPPEVWAFLRRERFFAMIIPQQYGGLGFSAAAHSEVVRMISSRSAAAAVTVMVPNSLGPGELLLKFGTDAQRDYWLQRLAEGSELPCFGLTSAEAGSDASAMTDQGVVCRETVDGEAVLGIRLNWRKRYITLAPVATVLGLAFKLYDPEQLLGGDTDLGITLALVPMDLPGVSHGRRHLPAMQAFQNGPTEGGDVFVPLDNIIGGQAQIGKGWPMLMSALAAGRGISLPSLAAAATALSARSTGAYARVREQFGIPIGKFEGVQLRLARLAASAYVLDGARRLTCAAIDQGVHPAVISAIVKAHATNRMREAVDDAMDVHAGKAIMDGPRNYLGNLYRAVPVGITVEGANILTRNMIIFGQGAIRCHPWLLQEMLAFEAEDESDGIDAFDQSFWRHVGHATKTLGRAWLRSWSFGWLSRAPVSDSSARHFRGLNRYAASFALLAEVTLLSYGGGLKRKEMVSARMGDILAELYLLSAVLKRWRDEGCQADDRCVLDYAMAAGSARIETAMDAVLSSLPSRALALLVRAILLPLGVQARGPDDGLIQRCAALLLRPSASRERVTAGLFLARGKGDSNGLADLEAAFDAVTAVESIRETLKTRQLTAEQARDQNRISAEQYAALEAADEAVRRVIEVDDYAAETLSRN